MPRSSSGFSSSSGSHSSSRFGSSRTFSSPSSSSYKSMVNYKPSPIAAYKPAPVPAKVTPQPSQMIVHQPPTFQPPTLFDSMKQGFGFGVGSSIAHSFFGPKPVIENKTIVQSSPINETFCKDITDQFSKCKTDGFCSEEFMKTLEENLKKCEKK